MMYVGGENNQAPFPVFFVAGKNTANSLSVQSISYKL
jgi:hypothetical protein